jgi:hypothetical protein
MALLPNCCPIMPRREHPSAHDAVPGKARAIGVVGVYAPRVPPQNPITRIEQVARDLGRLADEIEDYAGPDARKVLLHWQRELRVALAEMRGPGEKRLER